MRRQATPAVVAAWLLGFACAAGPQAQPVPIGGSQNTAQVETPRITTDSREYCDVLGGRVAVMHRLVTAPPPEATALASEGERLCAQGQYRNGVARLRRALAMLRSVRGSAVPAD